MSIVSATTTEEDLLGAKLWTVGYATASMTAGTGEELLGVLIGAKDVIYQTRTYGGTCSDVSISLYENTWSGGTPIASGNRNLNVTLSGPASYNSGITGTPSTLRTSIRLFAGSQGGAANLGNVPEGEWYILKANTRYILRIQNLGAGAGILYFRWTYRAID